MNLKVHLKAFLSIKNHSINCFNFLDLLDIIYNINSSSWLYTNLSSQQYFYKDFFWQTAIIAVFVIKCNAFSRAIHIHKDSKEKNETFSFWNYHKFADSEIFFNFPLSLMVWFLLLIKRKSNWLTTLFACIYIIILTDYAIYFIQVE